MSLIAVKGTLPAAVANGSIKEIVEILDKGEANMNQRSPDGFAPLCIAAFWGYADIVKLLLDRGADVNVSNKGTGWTPSHCAAFQGHGKVMLYLSQAKPDVTIKDSAGRTAVDFGSALDSIWPFFAVMGCQRTSKADLIKLDIIKKSVSPPADKDSGNARVAHVRTSASHLSRPGSSYIINTQLHQASSKSSQMSVALAFGDVLHEEDQTEEAGKTGTVWT